jgi:DICT domain-containing protein
MSLADAGSIAEFVDGADTSAATLLVLNRTQPAPLLSLLERAFASQPVHVEERSVPGPIEDEVVLLTADGVVASSPLSALAESFLLINADRFRTGANDLEAEAVPTVLRELTDIEFQLEGYPASSKEKLLLIVMSRFGEARALRAGAGELHTGFQRLSRLDDEYGTRTVYERLGNTDVETHVYGVDSERTAIPPGVAGHAGDGEEYRRSWFVVFEPADGVAAEPVALVAWETGDNRWEGMWTFDAGRTAAVGDYVRTTLAD